MEGFVYFLFLRLYTSLFYNPLGSYHWCEVCKFQLLFKGIEEMGAFRGKVAFAGICSISILLGPIANDYNPWPFV